MPALLLRRLGLMAVTLLLVSVLVFLLAQVLPGDLGRTILGPYATGDQVRALDHQLGLDRPLPIRYADWIGGFLTGDWGDSPVLLVGVRPLVLAALGRSALLALVTLAVVVPAALLLGMLAAGYRGRWPDRLVNVLSVGIGGVPEMVCAVLLIVVFAVGLGWFPVTAQAGGGFGDQLYHLILPALALTPALLGYLARMVRSSAAEALDADYTRTAVLKGLPTGWVLRRHVARNALVPAVAVLGVQVGWLAGGLVIIEQLFNYPGVGRVLLAAATAHDVPVLMAATLVTAVVAMLANLLADLLVLVLTPRLRRGGG